MVSNWTEVRRSVPAEEVFGVPDGATDWAVWKSDDTNETITMYKSELHGFFVVHHDEVGEESIEAKRVDEVKARNVANTLMG